ncbi:MAG: hypothetical protein J6Q48_06005 [Bacteroidaceae bacterium]|nr:hypothetical protein [Bacteroidaceae bacterium]
MNRSKKAMCNYIKSRIVNVLPYIYAAIAIALWRKLDANDEDKIDMIEELIAESQTVWNESADSPESILEWCKELTGIDLRGI